MFSETILGNVDERRTECEISDENGTTVAVVYENDDGWQVDVLREPREEEVGTFNLSVGEAKKKLSGYVNRKGQNPPKGLAVGEFSLWLMLKGDGTAMGITMGNKSDGR